MALRDITTGEVLSFRACAVSLRDGDVSIVERSSTGMTVFKMSGVCPVHEAAECVETYIASRRLASWSLRDFWSWRRNQRAGGAL